MQLYASTCVLLLLHIQHFDTGECHMLCQVAIVCAYNYFYRKSYFHGHYW